MEERLSIQEMEERWKKSGRKNGYTEGGGEVMEVRWRREEEYKSGIKDWDVEVGSGGRRSDK